MFRNVGRTSQGCFDRNGPEQLFWQQKKRPPLSRWPLVSCGAGGDRTLVQTTAKWAFYMLSRFIGFRSPAGEGHPTDDLGPVSYLRYGPPRRPVPHDDTSVPGRRRTGLPERYSSTLLLFTRIKPNSLRLLSCESVVYFASYGFVALGYGSHHTPGMLTTPYEAAVESRSAPRGFPKNRPRR